MTNNPTSSRLKKLALIATATSLVAVPALTATATPADPNAVIPRTPEIRTVNATDYGRFSVTPPFQNPRWADSGGLDQSSGAFSLKSGQLTGLMAVRSGVTALDPDNIFFTNPLGPDEGIQAQYTGLAPLDPTNPNSWWGTTPITMNFGAGTGQALPYVSQDFADSGEHRNVVVTVNPHTLPADTYDSLYGGEWARGGSGVQELMGDTLVTRNYDSRADLNIDHPEITVDSTGTTSLLPTGVGHYTYNGSALIDIFYEGTATLTYEEKAYVASSCGVPTADIPTDFAEYAHNKLGADISTLNFVLTETVGPDFNLTAYDGSYYEGFADQIGAGCLKTLIDDIAAAEIDETTDVVTITQQLGYEFVGWVTTSHTLPYSVTFEAINSYIFGCGTTRVERDEYNQFDSTISSELDPAVIEAGDADCYPMYINYDRTNFDADENPDTPFVPEDNDTKLPTGPIMGQGGTTSQFSANTARPVYKGVQPLNEMSVTVTFSPTAEPPSEPPVVTPPTVEPPITDPPVVNTTPPTTKLENTGSSASPLLLTVGAVTILIGFSCLTIGVITRKRTQ